jgi:hypothetical protein
LEECAVTTVFLVDDHEWVRRGVADLLDVQRDAGADRVGHPRGSRATGGGDAARGPGGRRGHGPHHVHRVDGVLTRRGPILTPDPS